MPAGILNLTGRALRIEQGADYALPLTFTQDGVAYDLTGVTIAAQMRETVESTDAVSFTITAAAPTTGVAIMSLTAATTTAITYTSGVWDMEFTDAGIVTRPLEGITEVKKNVTRP